MNLNNGGFLPPARLEPTTYGLEDRLPHPVMPRRVWCISVGLEPTRPNGQRILSPLCLPIPPWML